MKKDRDEMKHLQGDKSKVTIDSDTGAITIDLIASGPIRIVMTADGDIEVAGLSILSTARWTCIAGDTVERA